MSSFLLCTFERTNEKEKTFHESIIIVGAHNSLCLCRSIISLDGDHIADVNNTKKSQLKKIDLSFCIFLFDSSNENKSFENIFVCDALKNAQRTLCSLCREENIEIFLLIRPLCVAGRFHENAN